MGPEDGGGGLMKTRKKSGALQGEREKGKYDDHATEIVFQNKHLKALNKCLLLLFIDLREKHQLVLSLI